MLSLIAYPSIDPVLIAIGPFPIRWYALAYIAGLVLGLGLCAVSRPSSCSMGLWATA